MRQKITSIIAVLCIVIYVIALGFAAQGIYQSISERKITAGKEFLDLVDVAESAAVLGFMGEPFQDALRDGVQKSKTIQGIILSGPFGNEYSYERRPGIIAWSGDTPRFVHHFGYSREPSFAPLRIDGIRNVTLSATADYIDYPFFLSTLRQALMLIFGALILALITLAVEYYFSRKRVSALPAASLGEETSFSPPMPAMKEEKDGNYGEKEDAYPAAAAGMDPEETEYPQVEIEDDDDGKDVPVPKGLYSPHGNISWAAYTRDRLNSELHRSASYEQDLVFLVMQFRTEDPLNDQLFKEFAEGTVGFFSPRDLVFEWGRDGIAVIVPNLDLDQGFAKVEEFHSKIGARFSAEFNFKPVLCIGLSSRSGRLIDADRLIFECSQALQRALEDEASPIVAFKSDPEKYRAYIAAQGKTNGV